MIDFFEIIIKNESQDKRLERSRYLEVEHIKLRMLYHLSIRF